MLRDGCEFVDDDEGFVPSYHEIWDFYIDSELPADNSTKHDRWKKAGVNRNVTGMSMTRRGSGDYDKTIDYFMSQKPCANDNEELKSWVMLAAIKMWLHNDNNITQSVNI